MPIEVIMPKVDMDMVAGTIAAWHVQEGQRVEKGEALFDIETDKAAMEVESPASGVLHYVSAQAGDVVEIGRRVAWVFAEDETVEQPDRRPKTNRSETSAPRQRTGPTRKSETSQSTRPAGPDGPTRATPLARRVAKTNGIALSCVTGSGPRGRITRKDVEVSAKAYIKGAPTDAGRDAIASRELLDKLGIDYDAVGIDKRRARVAELLTRSKATVPHFYLEADCRIDNLLAFRKDVNDTLQASGSGKISINDLLVKASALALAAVPEANASWAGDEILRYKDANVSVAVSVDGGLMAPVLRQAQTKSILTISREITDLVSRAKQGKLASHECQCGSFGISNLGMFGVKAFSAIINPPESMILAVGKASRQFLEADDGSPVAATVLSVRLSCDHRVIDGVLGAQWLSEWQRLLENPFQLALAQA